MTGSESNDFGFKRLSLENWLTIDPAWNGVVMSASRADPTEAWVDDLVKTVLDPVVPVAIRKLFETARGVLVYSLTFYPLLTLGAEQLFRVLETAASAKCKMLNAPQNIKVFADRINGWPSSARFRLNDCRNGLVSDTCEMRRHIHPTSIYMDPE
jgi:hypothetical protein